MLKQNCFGNLATGLMELLRCKDDELYLYPLQLSIYVGIFPWLKIMGKGKLAVQTMPVLQSNPHKVCYVSKLPSQVLPLGKGMQFIPPLLSSSPFPALLFGSRDSLTT